MFVGIGFKGLQEGGRGVYEEHTLPPACRHRGRDGEKGGEGGKGWGERKWLYASWVGRFGRVSAGAIPFPSLRGNSTQARDTPAGQQHSISLFEPIILVYCICQITGRKGCSIL